MSFTHDSTRIVANMGTEEYTVPISPIANVSQPAVIYGPGANSCGNVQQLGELYNNQVNSWPTFRTSMDALPISRDTSQFDPSHVTEARNAAVSEQLLHAPIPLSGQQPFLFSGALNYSHLELQQQSSQAQETSVIPFQGYYAPVSTLGDLQYPQDTNQSKFVNNIVPYQNEEHTRTFPTPSELLVQLTGTNSPNPNVHCHSSRDSSDLARRPRRRLASRSLGLLPSDPTTRETISSHEKKRQYLECLEYYVTFLQQQLNLVGAEPVPLERVPQYRGLNNRSMRTLLVHMENATKKFNMRTLREEHRFVELRDAVYSQDVANATLESLSSSFFQ